MTSPFNSTPSEALSVSQLNRQARALLESHFDFVWVVGEISNFAAPSSGHWYFSLKDGNASVRCAMFRNRNQRIRFTPANGDAIRLRCRVSLYEGRGEFQLIVEHLEHDGAGALQAAFEQLKNKLLAEGLFDAQRKQPLPEHINRIGAITSPSGAAIHDILTVLRRRCPAIAIYLLPVAVQGEGAAAEISATIVRANRWQQEDKVAFDVLLLARGGGSLEDLWAFNEEIVARAIAASSLPVVSAVGHEVDFSIADLVADQRAATPSAAAELLSPDQQAWRARLSLLQLQLQSQVRRRLAQAARDLEHWQRRLKHPGHQIREQSQKLDDLEQRLILAQRNLLRRYHHQVALLEAGLSSHSPAPRLQRVQSTLNTLQLRLNQSMGHKLQRSHVQLQNLAKLLDSVSPLAILARGYAIVTDGSGAAVRDASRVSPGESLTARLARGKLAVTVAQVLADPEQGGGNNT